MAIRKIRVIGDPCLNKVCKPVVKMSQNMRDLIEDMFDTMYEAKGCGPCRPRWGSCAESAWWM